MNQLVDSYIESHRLDLFEIGTAINAAMSDDPKKNLGFILNPPEVIDIDSVHPMLRPSTKKKPSAA